MSANSRTSKQYDSATRRQGRERALGLLYEAEIKGVPVLSVVEALVVAPDQFASVLVDAVSTNAEQIDELIKSASLHWVMDRMAVVDRILLRIGVAELLDESGPPVAVVIDEAVELAKAYSTEESSGFVNGILSTLAVQLRA